MEDEKQLNIEEKKPVKTALIVEIVLAIAAIAGIIFLVVSLTSGSAKDPAFELSDNGAAITANNALGGMPEISDFATYNPISEETAIAKVQDGSMIEIKSFNGKTVYVNNFKDASFADLIKPSQEDLDEIINTGILAASATQADITGRTTVELNDTINIDYVGSIDGVEFEGGTGNYDLTIGSHSFIDDFEEQLIGAKKGDTVEVNVTFPENYGKEELNGKEALFKVTINDLLYTVSYPELTDEIVTEFFTNMGEDITTVEGCMEYCNDYIKEYNVYNNISEPYYVSYIDNNVVTAFYNDTVDYYVSISSSYGADLDTLLASSGMTVEALNDEIIVNAIQSALYVEMIEAIANELNVKINDADLEAFAKEQGAASLQEYYDMYGSQYTLKYYALEEKVVNTIKDMY